eukprot:1402499-Rhodomonas_salina.2
MHTGPGTHGGKQYGDGIDELATQLVICELASEPKHDSPWTASLLAIQADSNLMCDAFCIYRQPVLVRALAPA